MGGGIGTRRGGQPTEQHDPQKPTVSYGIPTPFTDICGCIWLSQNRVVVCDGTFHEIAAYNIDGEKASLNVFECQSAPWAIVRIDDTRFAVSLTGSKRILILEMTAGNRPTLELVRECVTVNRPWGLAYDSKKDRLLVQSQDGTIIQLKLDGTIGGYVRLAGAAKKAVANAWFMTFSNERRTCYLSCVKQDKIVAINLKGTILFVYSQSNLRSPRGIAVGPENSVYFCSYWNHSLQEITSTGRAVRQMQANLKNPVAISFNELFQCAVACDGDHIVWVYDKL